MPIVVVVKIMIVPAAAPVSPSVHPRHLYRLPNNNGQLSMAKVSLLIILAIFAWPTFSFFSPRTVAVPSPQRSLAPSPSATPAATCTQVRRA